VRSQHSPGGFHGRSRPGTGQHHLCHSLSPLLPGLYELSAVVYDSACRVPFDHCDRMFPFRIVEGSSPEQYGLIALGGTWALTEAEETGIPDHA